MNTLNKKYTSTFFVNPSDYEIFVKRWKAYVNSDEGIYLTSGDFLAYMVLRGKNYKKAFYPGRKMEYYNMPEGFYRAKYTETNHINIIGKDLLQKDWNDKVNKLLPKLTDNTYELDSYNDIEADKLLASVVVKENQTTVKQFMSLGGK